VKVKTTWVPSALTMANLFCGYFSVIQATNAKFIQASWLIVAAAVLDAIDGKVARFTKSSSQFGVEYDSLADVISFGFATSFLVYSVAFKSWGMVGLLISFGPLVFGSIRLARFNVRLKGFDKEFFEGLPIPAAAVTISTFVIFNFNIWGYLRWEKVFLFIIIAVSIMMVTGFRFATFPNLTFQSSASNRRKFLIVLTGVILIAIFPQESFFPLSALYVLSGPVGLIWAIFRNQDSGSNKNSKDKKE
jgi:CDP-diacylglycerol--serine O-phosphatidyltransferase